MAMIESSCKNGRWTNGLCECNDGYQTLPNRLLQALEYCSEVAATNKDAFASAADVMHLVAMVVTVLAACCALVATAYLVYGTVLSMRMAVNVTSASTTYQKLRAELTNSSQASLSTKQWVPPHPYVCVNLLHENSNCAHVIHKFIPKSQFELYLRKGDVITEVEVLKDGWCKGKLNGVLGFFPLSYVKMATNN